MEIKFYSIARRWTGEEITRGEGSLREVAERAAAGDADLMDADLRGADLRDADLGGANLMDANLRGADLRDANLMDADLRGADLRDADLGGANLGGANLMDANLRGADLRDADLGGADLGGADLGGANLMDANLMDANLRGANLGAPNVVDLEKRIEETTREPIALSMGNWHTCETTHCRAGWAITLAGDAGRDLEERFGPQVAGSLIYAASTPDAYIPNFFASDEDARADIVARAEKARGQ